MNQSRRKRTVVVDQVRQKLDEVDYFYQCMRRLQGAYIELNIVLRADGPDGRMLRRIFSYHFSAFLSAHRSVRYYIIRITGKVPGTAGWRKQIDQIPVLDALRHLRDIGIHEETINFGSTVKLAAGDPQITTSEFALHRPTLEANRRLKENSDAIDTLCRTSIIDIAKQGLETLKSVVDEGFSKGYLTTEQVVY